MMVPSCCGASNGASNIANNTNKLINNMNIIGNLQGQLTSSVVTGTIFGQRKGRVNFCVQEDPASPPLLLLEFAIPTHLLVKEMQSGLLRITLECDKKNSIANDPLYIDDPCSMPYLSLFSEPVWSMYCNGRKVGFAMKKTVKSDSDPAILNLMSLMQSVTSGAGVIPCRSNSNKHDLVGTLIKDKDGGTLASNKAGGSPASNKDGDILPNGGILLANNKDGGILPNNKDVMLGTSPIVDNGGVNVHKLVDGGKQENIGGVNSLYKPDVSGNLNLGPNSGPLQNDLTSGLIVEKPSLEEDELIYMRANYERVVGSPDSEAFHMINPDGSQCQELSIFLTRS